MKNTLTFLLIFAFGILFSQTHRFFYELSFKSDSTATDYTKDYYVLDITPDEQKFYNYEFLQNDSINKANLMDEEKYIFSSPELDIRLIHKKDGTFYNYLEKAPLYYLQKTNDKQNWTITPDKKKIGKYDVQKATTNFGGRTWEAWFASELPLVYGPYKFCGLPGLILEIRDTKENYIFSFTGNKNLKINPDTSDFLETQHKAKPFEITQKQWEKLQLDYFSNPLKNYESDLFTKNENGEIVKIDSRETIKAIQNNLHKNNNPIELDKAIKYPDK